ncbi:uncharacterized protein G6M90_00g069360 [Metarhizium brunneum]|uniref:Uncharacterized protein n=1 Tax=Metarhizium brunneum TaxID=500148 RepID=A0A7D5Z7A7_9HYPO|nr:hypothetical protein G6M90_00g069360 [Metarhizium brunneum]
MAAQYTELLRATGVDYLRTDAEEEDQTHLETMQAFDTIELDEEELVLAREAAKQRFNRTQVRPNLYSYDWSDAHGAFWDRVKKRLTTRLDAWGASLDKVQTKAVSNEFEMEILIETPTPITRVHRRMWRHNLGYSLLQPGTAIGTRKEEIYLLLAHFQLDDK